ncbi:MAG TPA: BadF/BadG/BcrA/BcrD ATPase family protein [Trueperaceae bacterium]
MIGLGIDAGGTGIRWLLSDGGAEVARGELPAAGGHVMDAAALGSVRETLGALSGEVLAVSKPDAVVAGFTGFHPGAPVADDLRRCIAAALGVAEEKVGLCNDMRIAYAAAFRPAEGVLVYGGTGSIAYHLTASGEVLRSGGHGYLIDDAGGGFWIGRQGLKRVLRWRDEEPLGRVADRPLAEEIYLDLRGESWEEVVREVYGGGRSRVAALAPAVARAAQRGDAAAREILELAGVELARLAVLVARRLDRQVPVAFMGGVARLSPIVAESLRRELPEGMELKRVTREPVEGAAVLALELASGELEKLG